MKKFFNRIAKSAFNIIGGIVLGIVALILIFIGISKLIDESPANRNDLQIMQYSVQHKCPELRPLLDSFLEEDGIITYKEFKIFYGTCRMLDMLDTPYDPDDWKNPNSKDDEMHA